MYDDEFEGGSLPMEPPSRSGVPLRDVSLELGAIGGGGLPVRYVEELGRVVLWLSGMLKDLKAAFCVTSQCDQTQALAYVHIESCD